MFRMLHPVFFWSTQPVVITYDWHLKTKALGFCHVFFGRWTHGSSSHCFQSHVTQHLLPCPKQTTAGHADDHAQVGCQRARDGGRAAKSLSESDGMMGSWNIEEQKDGKRLEQWSMFLCFFFKNGFIHKMGNVSTSFIHSWVLFLLKAVIFDDTWFIDSWCSYWKKDDVQ